MRKNISIALLFIALALPALAKNRIVTFGAGFVQFSGTVVDATTGRPVVEAEVVSDSRSVLTDATGSFKIMVPAGRSSTLTIRRTGYQSLDLTINPATPSSSPITLLSRPNVVVKKTNGTTVQLDADSLLFEYAGYLSSTIRDRQGSFCIDGLQTTIDRDSIARMTGFTTAGGASCCAHDAMWVDLTMKTGGTQHAAVVFDCYGYDVYFRGFEHETHQMVFVKFSDIAQVDFP